MEKKIENYIELTIKIGVNLQKGQILVINSPVEVADFTRKVVETAYKNGAREVVVHWNDELCGKYKYMYGTEELFENYPQWQVESVMEYMRKGAAFLSIYASDPELLKNVEQSKIAKYQRARSRALKEHYDRIMNNYNQWCVVSVPTNAWAGKIFPELSKEESKEKLWRLIFSIVRADKADPIKEWKNHLNSLKKNMNYLNEKKFKKLIYKNSLGTNLEIGLPEGHIWTAGGETSKEGVYFVANMPTEEIFTLPKKDEVNGIVYSSKPFSYGGNLIEKFSLTFKEGKVVEFSAEKGKDTLEQLLKSDEGATYLGEVALVPYDSPISNSNTIFYNTLFDENASCHLALGQAYPICLENGSEMDESQLREKGVNISMVHEDFMIGTSDLEIIGIDYLGNETLIMKNGNFAFTEK
ncbi:aminopeptidase [Fusobacterium varium]